MRLKMPGRSLSSPGIRDDAEVLDRAVLADDRRLDGGARDGAAAAGDLNLAEP
jgi:hypothetical protein